VLQKIQTAVAVFFLSSVAMAQQNPATNVFSVLPWSATYASSPSGVNYRMQSAFPNIYTYNNTNSPVLVSDLVNGTPVAGNINTAGNYGIVPALLTLTRAVNSTIATSLSILPLASPSSGVILKKNSTGAESVASATLGPILTERAETIGRGSFFLGFTNQNYHFTSLNGRSLNNLGILYTGGPQQSTQILNGSQPMATVPASVNMGMDVRLSQDVAFFTYGVTNRFDLSLGLPLVHAAVSARTYDATIYGGNGLGNPVCWCADTFTPGVNTLYVANVGQASMSKTGLGDILVRGKGTIIERSAAVVALGVDFRFPTGDEQNLLGSGTTSVRPFTAISLKPMGDRVVFAPHLNVGWQFSGKSSLAGNLTPTPQTINAAPPTGNEFPAAGGPFLAPSKGYLPDVFSWAVGGEIGFGRSNTVVVDILGNQIGWVHGIANTRYEVLNDQALPLLSPRYSPTNPLGTAAGLVDAGFTSYGQYSGSFGYKVKVAGNLVAMVNALVRFDNNGLTARFTPLFGLGYTF
jgi:hypothetical protein